MWEAEREKLMWMGKLGRLLLFSLGIFLTGLVSYVAQLVPTKSDFVTTITTAVQQK